MKTYELKTTENWKVRCTYNVVANSLDKAKEMVGQKSIPYIDVDVDEEEITNIEEDK